MDVLQFDCSRKFLRDLIFERRQVGLRSLARRSGFKSPSVLSLICTGKRRWTMESSDRVANGLGLKGREREYFLQLARLDRVPSVEEATRMRRRLTDLQRRREEGRLQPKQFLFLTQWYYPVILALLSTEGFRSDATWIASRLGNRVTLNQVRSALGDLINLGLARFDEENRLVPTNGPLATGEDEAMHAAVRTYHRNMIQRAEEALATAPEEREITGLTINVAREKVPALKTRVRQFLKELNEELSAEPHSDEVYQVNVQLFPLTQGEA